MLKSVSDLLGKAEYYSAKIKRFSVLLLKSHSNYFHGTNFPIMHMSQVISRAPTQLFLLVPRNSRKNLKPFHFHLM